MPVYEYRCDACAATFELRRPLADSGTATSCPNGHPGARRILSVFATTGRSGAPVASCCGGGCGCAAGR